MRNPTYCFNFCFHHHIGIDLCRVNACMSEQLTNRVEVASGSQSKHSEGMAAGMETVIRWRHLRRMLLERIPPAMVLLRIPRLRHPRPLHPHLPYLEPTKNAHPRLASLYCRLSHHSYHLVQSHSHLHQPPIA